MAAPAFFPRRSLAALPAVTALTLMYLTLATAVDNAAGFHLPGA